MAVSVVGASKPASPATTETSPPPNFPYFYPVPPEYSIAMILLTIFGCRRRIASVSVHRFHSKILIARHHQKPPNNPSHSTNSSPNPLPQALAVRDRPSSRQVCRVYLEFRTPGSPPVAPCPANYLPGNLEGISKGQVTRCSRLASTVIQSTCCHYLFVPNYRGDLAWRNFGPERTECKK